MSFFCHFYFMLPIIVVFFNIDKEYKLAHTGVSTKFEVRFRPKLEQAKLAHGPSSAPYPYVCFLKKNTEYNYFIKILLY